MLTQDRHGDVHHPQQDKEHPGGEREPARAAELEADRRGLVYMATAGYDPRAAVAFWRRMKAATGGDSQPEWLSTHPSNDNRIAQIESLLPAVVPIYEQTRGSR